MAAVGLRDFKAARDYAEEAVALARELGKRRELFFALIALAQLHRIERSSDIAERLYLEALQLTRELGDDENTDISLLNLAMVSIDLGSGARAREFLIEALAVAVRIRSQRIGQSALEVTAGLCASEGDWENAAKFYGAAEAQAERAGLQADAVDQAFLQPLYQEALALTRELGDEENTAISLLNLAMVSIDLGATARAREFLLEALTLARKTGSRRIGQSALEVTAGLCSSESDWSNATKFYGAAEAQAERADLRADAVDEAFLQPLIARARRALAEKEFRSLQQEGRAWRYEDALIRAHAVVTEGTKVSPRYRFPRTGPEPPVSCLPAAHSPCTCTSTCPARLESCTQTLSAV